MGITGASGSIYGLRLLERLRNQQDVETHLILSRAGEKTAYLETGQTAAEIKNMADYYYSAGRYRLPAGQRILSD